jgi:kynurenine formamidase
MAETSIPRYHELPLIPELRARHAWEVYGRDDQLGRVNLMTPRAVLAAAAHVRRGAVFNLCLPLDKPNLEWAGRKPFVHNIFTPDRNTQEDYLDGFYLQGSTQWDALRHMRAREFGYYGGRQDADAGPQGGELGIDKWAEHGLVGRGVLADVYGYFEKRGRLISAVEDFTVTPKMLQDTLDEQGVALASGDVLMVRTGFVDAYLSGHPELHAGTPLKACPGLEGSEEMAEYLWDSGVAAIACDNPAVEVLPGSAAVGLLHRRLIPLLGFPLGEFFTFRPLSEDCARDKQYACLFVSAPLNLPRGVGSPANALAIK